MSLINREALYEKACDLEAQALAYIGKIANDKTKIEEWKIWSAILIERTGFKHDIFDAPEELPSAQPEITEEQAIEHLQSTGWMQRHDRILTESTWDIIRCRDCKYYKDITSIHGECECGEMWQSLFGEVTEVEAIEVHKDHYCGYAERRTDERTD